MSERDVCNEVPVVVSPERGRAVGLPRHVRIVEVGPRDGLQNWPLFVPTDVKLELIHRLAASGLATVEATSFVSAKWVPQMRDAEAVMSALAANARTAFTALVPNLRGYEAAVACGAREVAIFASATESFSQKNINCSIDESFERFAPIAEVATNDGVRVRGYVSCSFGCPYEGAVAIEAVADVTRRLFELGCYEVALGDTIGIANPVLVGETIERVARQVPLPAVAVHFHDTWGMALANIVASLQMGVTVVDASVAGLGGCPYARTATGNVSSEDVVHMLHAMGVETGVDLARLIDAGEFISNALGRTTESRVAKAFASSKAAQTQAAAAA